LSHDQSYSRRDYECSCSASKHHHPSPHAWALPQPPYLKAEYIIGENIALLLEDGQEQSIH